MKKRKYGYRIIAFLLAAFMLFSMDGVMTLAATVSENETADQTQETEEPEEDLTEDETEEAAKEDAQDKEKAAKSESEYGIENDYEIEATDSFGEMYRTILEENASEQEANGEYGIFSIEVNGTTATVSLQTIEDCTLVVGVYDETGKKLVASGAAKVEMGSERAEVAINNGTIPAYFYLRGFLVQNDTLRPLCSVFDSSLYTQSMQELLASTTADYAADRILNLDESTDNNFAVYAEDTIVIEEENTTAQLVTEDEANETYVFENADAAILALQQGDIFSFEHTDGNVLIVKIAEITIDGTTVTIKGTPTAMEQAFDYVKIDSSADAGQGTIDTSEMAEGVTYEGLVSAAGSGDLQEEAVDADVSFEKKAEFKLTESKAESEGEYVDASAKVSGSVDLGVKIGARLLVSMDEIYVEFKIDYELGFDIAVSGSVRGKIPLCKAWDIRLCAGVYAHLSPCIVLEVSGEFTFEGKLKGTVGTSYSTATGIKNLTKAPKIEVTVKAQVTLFVGLSLEPEAKIMDKCELSLTAETGVEVKAKLEVPVAGEKDKEHDCSKCIDGDVYARFTLGAKLKMPKILFFEGIDASKKWEVKTDNILDFYYSFDKNEFGFTPCPYYKYKTTFMVVDSAGKPIRDAQIDLAGACYRTNAKGVVDSYYLHKGKYKATITKDGYAKKEVVIKVKDDAVRKKVSLAQSSIAGGGGGGNDFGDVDISSNMLGKLSMGTFHSAAVTNDGSLYIWGSGISYDTPEIVVMSKYPEKIMDNVTLVSLGELYSAVITEETELYTWGENVYGGLGDGTTTDREIPTKIMNDVAMVSLGVSHSAAITKDGDLYTWGKNWYGQLGDGTPANQHIPIKIMGDVVMVSLGADHSAAITTDSSLYMWGMNNAGQLGDGTRISREIPTKIMNDVARVSLGYNHSAAITTDTSLYTWGTNADGELGDGTTTERHIPTKIMDNVLMVCLGDKHSAAITWDGSLYMWGNNEHGQLGDGTTTERHTPTKIMDNVVMVSLGGAHSAAITKDGSLYTWGNNDHGQLGDGTTTTRYTPTKISIPTLATESADVLEPETAIAADTATATESEETSDMTLNIESLESDHANIFSGKGSFTGLLPNETYNYYVMKSVDAEDVFAADNLLYIGQGVSDASGNLTFHYETKEDYKNPAAFAVGMTAPDISTAKVTVPKLTYNGTEQFANPTVMFNGVKLTEERDYYLTGDFKAKDAGTYQLTVEGTGMYSGFVAASYQMVKDDSEESGTGEDKKATSIRLNSSALDLKTGESRKLSVTVLPSDATNKNVKWKSDNPAVATVDANGNVKAVSEGRAVISASTTDGSNLTTNCTVNVRQDDTLPQGPDTWVGKTGTEGFVYRLYNVALCREAEEAGFNDWNRKLTTKTRTAAEVAYGFIFSDEFKNKNYNDAQYVRMLYRTMFGREADEGGMNDWLDALANGMSREYVYKGFVESVEFSNLCNSYGVTRGTVGLSSYRDKNRGATGFIARLYTKMLGRKYEDEGLEYWCRMYLTGSKSIEAIATDGFLHSQELQNQNLSNEEFVKRMYQTFLNREPEEAGLKDWVHRLETGEVTRDTLVYGFTNSKEFANIKAEYGL